jgi:hypothetical protein
MAVHLIFEHDGGPNLQDEGPSPRRLLRPVDSTEYLLDHLAAAATEPGFALLGLPRGRWFRATELEPVLARDRSTIRKHHADPMFRLGLLARREAETVGPTAFEYSVTDSGETLRRAVERLLGSTQPTFAQSSTVVLIASEDPQGTADLINVLEAALPGMTRQHGAAFALRSTPPTSADG